MRSLIPALLLLAPALKAAEEAPTAPKKKIAAISLLPNGSELQGVMLPRYDDQQRLIGVLKAKCMTLVNDETIAGERISIEFFNPDRSPRGRADLTRANFNQSRGTLEALEPVTIQSDKLSAKGRGLVYAFEQGQGFLLGPATTWIQANHETTMKSSNSKLRATAMVGASLLSQPLSAAQPPPVTADEKAAIQADSQSMAPEHAATMNLVRADLAKDLDASSAANAAAKAFLENAQITSTTSSQAAAAPAEAKPLDLQPGPTDTVISSDGGMYFDADEGVFVYLKNVRVTDPRFNLSGANELKVFLEKTQETAAGKSAQKDKDDKSGIGIGGKFGDVERIVATGAVLIDQKPENGKEPIQASGAIFSYNVKADQVIISGGFPWVVQGKQGFRAKEPNLILRISPKAGEFSTEGAWDTILNLQQKK